MDLLVNNLLSLIILIICVIALVKVYKVAKSMIALNNEALLFFKQLRANPELRLPDGTGEPSDLGDTGPRDVEII